MTGRQGNFWSLNLRHTLKLFLLWFVPAALVITAGVYIFYRQQTISERSLLLSQQRDQVKLLQRQMLQALQTSSKLTETLAEMPQLRNWPSHPTRRDKNQLAAVFLTVLDNMEIYDQVRFIALNGNEVVRVHQQHGRPNIVPEAKLQNKSQRYYFQIGRELGTMEQFISPLDLNVEQGQIEQPWKPTIRFVRSVFDRHGQRKGVLVVNYLAQDLLRELDQTMAAPGIAMLLNQQGYWLLGARRERLFGFMFADGQNRRMGIDHPKAWQQIEQSEMGQIFTGKDLLTYRKLSPLGTMPAKPHWIVISFVPAQAVDSLVGLYLSQMLLIWLLVLTAAGIGAWVLARNQTRRRLAEERIANNARNQEVLNRLLELSLEGGSLDYQLHAALSVVLAIPWLSTLSRGAVFLVDSSEPQTLRMAAAKDIDPQLLTICQTVPFGHCHCGRAAASGEIQHSSHVDRLHQNSYPGMPPHGHYCLPIMSGENCLGVMVLYQVEGLKPNGDEIEFLGLVSRTLAGIIEASRSAQKLTDSEARLKAVLNTAVEGVVTIDSAGVIESFNRAAEKIFGYQATEIIGKPVDTLQPSDLNIRHQDYIDRYLETGEARVIGIGREVMGRKKDGELFPLYLAVSQVQQGGRITFTGILRDITKLKKYEAQLTKAKEDAEATSRELADKQARLDEDLQAAAGIQRALLPEQLPNRPEIEMLWHFEPSQHIGGDIFEAFMLDKDHLLLYMVDVSGHGVPSALVTVSVHDMLEPHSGLIIDAEGNITPPGQVLSQLDKQYPLERFDKHFTIAYAVLNLPQGELVYSTAAHPPPVLLRSSGDLELLEAGGSLIGLDMDMPFEEGRLTLKPGDQLLLYTDGVVEYQNAAGELFGQEKFLGVLAQDPGSSMSGIFEALDRELKAFAHGTPPADDVSLLALEYRGPYRS
jgi:PAS domain S-box-containing protein